LSAAATASLREGFANAEAYGLGGLMTAGTALTALKPPAIDKSMLVALATRTAEPIGPAGLLQSSYCYAQAQGPHIAPRCHRAAGTEAGRGLSGNGWHCATWPAWYMRLLEVPQALRIIVMVIAISGYWPCP